MKTQCLLAAGVLATASFCATAQNLKPGLWEITSRTQGGSGQMEQKIAQMQQQMANLPPEQRRMMQDMMAKHGVSMAADGVNMKVCMTRQMVERNEIPAQQGGNCTQVSSPREGDRMKISFTCAMPPSSGEGTITFVNPEAYDVKMTVQAAMKGRQEKIGLDGSGKWLSADCGAIKPMAETGK